MKVKIYPKVRYLDNDAFELVFIPTPASKSFLAEHAHLVEQQKKGKVKNYPHELFNLCRKNRMLFDRDQWCEVEFKSFVEYVKKWFGHDTFALDVQNNLMTGEVPAEWLYRISGFDYQWYDEESDKWKSRLD